MASSVSTPTSQDVVLAAALTVLRRDGASGLRVRAVATEAGCSTTGIYTNFGNKHGLVEAIFVDGFERLDMALASASRRGSLVDRLRARCVEYRRWALANSTSYMVMFGGAVPEFSPSPEAARRGLQTFTNLVDRVGAAIDAGEFAPGDATAVAYHVWATKHGYVMLEVARMSGRPPKEAEAIYAAGLTRLFDGLARTT